MIPLACCHARDSRCRHPPFWTTGAWKHRCDVISQVPKAVCTSCRAASVESFVHQSCGGYKLQSDNSPRVTWSSAGYQSRCPFGDISVFQVGTGSLWVVNLQLTDLNRASLSFLFKAKASATWHHHVRRSQNTLLSGGSGDVPDFTFHQVFARNDMLKGLQLRCSAPRAGLANISHMSCPQAAR